MSSKLARIFWLCAILIAFLREGLAQTDPIPPSAELPKPNVLDSNGSSSKFSCPYSIIVNRNIFGLSDPAPPSPSPPSITLPPPNIKLTGFIKLPGEPPWAIFVSIPRDPRCMATNFIAAEGGHNEYLRLANILADRKSARIIIAGNELTLSLQDGNFVAPAPAGPPVPGPWLRWPRPPRFPR